MIKTVESKFEKNDRKPEVALTIGKTLLLFFVGWIGLQLLATAAQILRCVAFNVSWTDIELFLIAENSSQVPQTVKDVLGTSESNMLINGSVYIVAFIGLLAILNLDIKKFFDSFKNSKAFLAGLIGLAIIYIFNILYSNIVDVFYPLTPNNNETSLDNIIVVYPILSYLIFGLVGPIVEELTYRVGLFDTCRKISKSRVLAYVITMIVFAFIHFEFGSVTKLLNGDPTLFINEILNMPKYLFAAATFVYLYEKYGLAGSLSCHVFNNFLSISFVIINSLYE